MSRPLNVYAGDGARARIAREGWHPDLFGLLLGASGGPKWLVLSQLDRVLFPFLRRGRSPLALYGTSIGSWRHACLAQSDPVAATARFEQAYIQQRYTARPQAAEVTSVSRDILRTLLGEKGAAEILDPQRLQTHIGTSRGRGLLSAGPRVSQAMFFLGAAAANAAHRHRLQRWFQRVVFAQGPASPTLAWDDFDTARVPLTAHNLQDALVGSGSIPLVLEPVEHPVGAPRGRYWDGGIVDYHPGPAVYRGADLILYPHFVDGLTPGWFDKPWPRRRTDLTAEGRLVLLAPSREFVASLPGGKIPDRKDFDRFDSDARIRVWQQVVARCEALAEALHRLFTQSDPLDGVRPLPALRPPARRRWRAPRRGGTP